MLEMGLGGQKTQKDNSGQRHIVMIMNGYWQLAVNAYGVAFYGLL